MLLTCTTCFHLYLYFSTHYVYCYASTYQDEFLVCENLLGSKSDSDVVQSFLISLISDFTLCLFHSRTSFLSACLCAVVRSLAQGITHQHTGCFNVCACFNTVCTLHLRNNCFNCFIMNQALKHIFTDSPSYQTTGLICSHNAADVSKPDFMFVFTPADLIDHFIYIIFSQL